MVLTTGLFVDLELEMYEKKDEKKEEEENGIEEPKKPRFEVLKTESEVDVDKTINDFIFFFNSKLQSQQAELSIETSNPNTDSMEISKISDQQKSTEKKKENEECGCDPVDLMELQSELKDIYQSINTRDSKSEFLQQHYHWVFLAISAFLGFRVLLDLRKYGRAKIYKVWFNPNGLLVKYTDSSKKDIRKRIDKNSSYFIRDNSLIGRGSMVGSNEYNQKKNEYLSRIEVVKLLGDYDDYINPKD